jgi:hypothetical protein
MARQLISEKPYVLVVREFENVESWPRYYGIITSYTILRAKIINLLDDDVFSMALLNDITDYGTIVHLDTEENVQSALPLIPKGVRYFGYINATEGIVVNNFAYIGLPISLNYMPDIATPEGMRDVVYPHITLSSLKNNKELKEYVTMVGKATEVKLCDTAVATPHIVAYGARIKYNDYHVTRCVANGKAPYTAKKETVHTKSTNVSLVAFPVLM